MGGEEGKLGEDRRHVLGSEEQQKKKATE